MGKKHKRNCALHSPHTTALFIVLPPRVSINTVTTLPRAFIYTYLIPTLKILLQICNTIRGNTSKRPTGCSRMVFICKNYCPLNMFRAPLCPSSGARELHRWLREQPGRITYSSTPDQQTANQSAMYHRQQPSV